MTQSRSLSEPLPGLQTLFLEGLRSASGVRSQKKGEPQGGEHARGRGRLRIDGAPVQVVGLDSHETAPLAGRETAGDVVCSVSATTVGAGPRSCRALTARVIPDLGTGVVVEIAGEVGARPQLDAGGGGSGDQFAGDGHPGGQADEGGRSQGRQDSHPAQAGGRRCRLWHFDGGSCVGRSEGRNRLGGAGV